jgi:hypothetical protein
LAVFSLAHIIIHFRVATCRDTGGKEKKKVGNSRQISCFSVHFRFGFTFNLWIKVESFGLSK